MPEGRTMWFYLVYDWLTRKKEFFFDQPTHPEDRELPKDRRYNKTESLYRCIATFPPSSQGKAGTEIKVDVVREEWDTAPKKSEKQSMVMWLAQRIFAEGPDLAPPHSFGPGNPFWGTRDEKKPVVRFQIGVKKYKIVVSKDD